MEYDKYPCCECGEMTSPDGVFCSACEEASAIGHEADALAAKRYRKLEEFFSGATPDQWKGLHSGYPDLAAAVESLP